jgi:hypothetical protein
MARQVKCYCGCRSLVSASTERRHRIGKATPRVKASHAARHTLYVSHRLSQARNNVSSARPLSHASHPDLVSQPLDHAHMDPLDDIPRDGGNLDIPTSNGVEAIRHDHLNDDPVSTVVSSVQDAWHRQHRAIVEDYASDDEDSLDGNCDDDDDDDGFDWQAEMCDDDGVDVDGGLGVEDNINEDFERELAEFGKESPLTRYSPLTAFPQLRKLLRKKWLSSATLHSRLKVICQMKHLQNYPLPFLNQISLVSR